VASRWAPSHPSKGARGIRPGVVCVRHGHGFATGKASRKAAGRTSTRFSDQCESDLRGIATTNAKSGSGRCSRNGEQGLALRYRQMHGLPRVRVACATWNATGAVSWRQIVKIETGVYPKVSTRNLSMPCLHCDHAPAAVVPGRRHHQAPMDWFWSIRQRASAACSALGLSFGVPQFGAEERCRSVLLRRSPGGAAAACEEVCPPKRSSAER